MNAFMRILQPIAVRVAFAMVLAVAAGSTALADSTTFVSDDFNGRNLKRPLWTLSNPDGDATILPINTGTDSASMTIGVPAGRAHDISADGYRVPRILQTVTNTDFRLEVKFLSGVTGGTPSSYQVQGIVVEQNINNLIRFDFTTTSSTPNFRVYAATFIGGLSSGGTTRVNQEIGPNGLRPIWMRVERTGDTWTQSYSFDGSTWTVAGTFVQALAVARVGVFAGNAGSSPQAHTAVIDYFMNLDNPGAAEDSLLNPPDDVAPFAHSIRASRTAANALELKWHTDELSTAVLDYGVTSSYGSQVVLNTPAYEHTVLLTGLQPSVSYDYRITSSDDSANSEPTGNNIARTDDLVSDRTTISDDFLGSSLNGSVWTQANPVGDGTFSIGSGELVIGVPNGVNHDIWAGGARAPRVVQSVGGANSISAEVKFASGVTGSSSSYQLQGLLFEQDQNNAIRFDFVNGTGGTRAYAAAFEGGYASPATKINTAILPLGTAPLYLKVTQLGALWTMEYSIDGISWSVAGSFWQFLRTSSVGVYGGNAGTSPPAFSARVQYFKAALPGQLELLSPVNGAVNTPTSPTLSWQAGLQANAYHIQVANDTGFSVVVLSDTNALTTSRTVDGLLYSSKYFWRVRGKNSSGYGAFSIPWSFTTQSSAPGTPALVFPPNGATGQPTNLSLTWMRVNGATSYRVQVSTEATFTSGLIVDDPAVVDTVKVLSGLSSGLQYFWRVNASSVGGTSDYSPVFNFTTVAAVPGTVTLLNPENGASVNAAGVSFAWNSTAGATKYWHELAVDALFQFVVIDSQLTGTSKDMGGLIANQTYYWRVKAGNASGWGPYSEGRSFVAILVGVEDERGIPTAFDLSQNFPNPFNPATSIEFALPQEARVTIDVHNAIGQKVATLLDEVRGAGYHTVTFDASLLPSGVYLYRLTAGHYTSVRKMLLTK